MKATQEAWKPGQPLPDLGSPSRVYSVRLTEREINAIHFANGFLQSALRSGRGSVKDHYCPSLASASDYLALQTEGPGVVGPISEKGNDFPELRDEQMPADWRPKPEPGTWSVRAVRWWLAGKLATWSLWLTGGYQ